MPAHNITVLLVDDHGLVRRGFRRMIEDDPEIVVVGEAGNGAQAVEKVAAERPDVVVMDFTLPDMDGAMATRLLLKAAPETAVLVLSMHSEPSYVKAALDAGARGYLLKNAVDMELAEAIKNVSSGVPVIDPLLENIPSNGAAAQPALTTRELEVLQLIVRGKSNKEIASLLGLSVNTVGVHRANLMQTLDIHNTAELVVYAIRNGLANIS